MRVSDMESHDFAPYAPMPMSFFADLPRLTSGNSCTWLILTLWAKGPGRGYQTGKAGKGKRAEWTLALSLLDLAQICRCDVRTIEREIAALEKRGLAEIVRAEQVHPETQKFIGKGEVAARLKYGEWEALPDYKSQVVEMPGTDEETADPETVDESRPGNQRVTGKSAVRIAAGKLSKVYPVSTGVKAFRYKADGAIDLDVTCVIQAGELVVTSRLPEAWQQKLELLKSGSNVSNGLDGRPRHGCRGDDGIKAGTAGREKGGKRGTAGEKGVKSLTVDHPRAAELVKLFDPLLGKSQAVVLADAPDALITACAAVGDCDHDFLVHFAMNRSASGPIRKPSYVALICKEALTSWQASKSPDASGTKHYNRAEIDQMIAAERAAKGKGRK